MVCRDLRYRENQQTIFALIKALGRKKKRISGGGSRKPESLLHWMQPVYILKVNSCCFLKTPLECERDNYSERGCTPF